MIIDWTIRFDQVLALVTLMFGGGALWREIKTLNTDVRDLKAGQDKQTELLIGMARQDQQLKDHDRRLNMLEGVK